MPDRVTPDQLDALILQHHLVLHFPDSNAVASFNSFSELMEFVNKEEEVWQAHNAGGQLGPIKAAFGALKNRLQQATQQEEQTAARTIEQAFQQANSNSNWETHVYSTTAIGKFLIELASKNRDRHNVVAGAYLAYRGKLQPQPHLTERDFLRGVFRYLSFDGLDEQVGARSRAEGKAFGDLEQKVRDLHEKESQRLSSLVTEMEQQRGSVQREHEDDQAERKTLFLEFLQESERERNQLEQTYKEKLRIEAPVKAWNEHAATYRERGYLWMAAAAVSVTVFVTVALTVVYQPLPQLDISIAPESPIPTLFNLRGTLLVALSLSAIGYFISLCAKLAISAIHIARDAEERIQLTHVFLAFVKDERIEPKDREIILQSLFSRADTGLLRRDSGPTMPSTPLKSLFPGQE